MENSCKLNRVIYGYGAELCVPHGRGIGAQAKNACVLTRDYPSECGTVRKILMQDLVKLGMRDAQLPASDSRYALDGGVMKISSVAVRRRAGSFSPRTS